VKSLKEALFSHNSNGAPEKASKILSQIQELLTEEDDEDKIITATSGIS